MGGNVRLATLSGHLIPPAGPAIHPSAASPTTQQLRQQPGGGLHGLSQSERYFFETQGFLVIPDVLSRQQLDEMNAAFDAMDATGSIPRRTGGERKGGLPELEGEFGRGDTGELMAWPEPHCEPFRRLLSLPRTVRVMLDLIGPGFHYSSANAIVMDVGAEGQQLHGGNGGYRDDGSVAQRDAWTMTVDRNGQIECNLINCMYQLADIGPEDGAYVPCCRSSSAVRAWRAPTFAAHSITRWPHRTVVVPGSHKSFFSLPQDVRGFATGDRFGPLTGGALVKPVPCRAGSLLIFTEALTRKQLWPAHLTCNGSFHGSKSSAELRLSRARVGADGALPWRATHQRRTLLYRYSSRGFDGGNGAHSGVGERQSESFHDTSGFRGDMSPLGQAILEPAHLGNRPDMVALLVEEEQGGGG